MKVCIHCEFTNLEGALICVSCGKPLGNYQLQDSTLTISLPDGDSDKYQAPSTQMMPGLTLMVRVGQGFRPIALPHGRRVVLGRSDRDGVVRPDVDLSLFEAMERGVSRQHAAIDCSSEAPTIMDLASKNGTYLNGKLLKAYQATVVRHGDEVRLGKMTVFVYLQ